MAKNRSSAVGIFPDVQVCDDLFQFFKQSDQKRPGATGTEELTRAPRISSILSCPSGDFGRLPVMCRYLDTLMEVVLDYMDKYPRSGETGNWFITEDINIQYYKPGSGYRAWHAERTSNRAPIVNRHVVFMTYLNDVHDAGGTEFLYQRINVKPRKGLSLIWPSELDAYVSRACGPACAEQAA